MDRQTPLAPGERRACRIRIAVEADKQTTVAIGFHFEGERPLQGVVTVTGTEAEGISFRREVPVEDLLPGETRTVRLRVSVADEVWARIRGNLERARWTSNLEERVRVIDFGGRDPENGGHGELWCECEVKVPYPGTGRTFVIGSVGTHVFNFLVYWKASYPFRIEPVPVTVSDSREFVRLSLAVPRRFRLERFDGHPAGLEVSRRSQSESPSEVRIELAVRASEEWLAEGEGAVQLVISDHGVANATEFLVPVLAAAE